MRYSISLTRSLIDSKRRSRAFNVSLEGVIVVFKYFNLWFNLGEITFDSFVVVFDFSDEIII